MDLDCDCEGNAGVSLRRSVNPNAPETGKIGSQRQREESLGYGGWRGVGSDSGLPAPGTTGQCAELHISPVDGKAAYDSRGIERARAVRRQPQFFEKFSRALVERSFALRTMYHLHRCACIDDGRDPRDSGRMRVWSIRQASERATQTSPTSLALYQSGRSECIPGKSRATLVLYCANTRDGRNELSYTNFSHATLKKNKDHA